MKLLDSIGARWSSFSSSSRIVMVISVAGLAATGMFAYQQMNKVDWAVLYANVDDATASEVLAGLDAHGIEYTVEGNGTRILVPRDQLATSRVALAGDGITAQATPDGFEEIFANQGLASSDFEQRVNYERALEGELARTLLTMEPIAGARVQLSIPERSVFIGTGTGSSDQPTASVMLSLRRELSKAEADTIANVVASSVEGLTPDQVTIASADGTLLRAAGADAGSVSGTSNIEVTSAFERDLSTRLTELARTLSGQPGATVEVRAVLDFTTSTIEQEVIDPTKNTPTAEHETVESWTGTGGTVGGTTGTGGGPTNPGGANDGTYEKTDKTTTYVPGDRTITHSTVSTPTVTRLSVAVVVPVVTDAQGTPTTVIDEATLSRLLGTAAGIDDKRGDSIEVALVPALATDTGDLVTDPGIPAAAPAASPTTLLAAAGAAGAFLMLLIGTLLGRRKQKRAPQFIVPATKSDGKKAKKDKKGATDDTELLIVPSRATERPTGRMDQEAVAEIKADLERMLAESPESLAALLSGWMTK